MSSKVEGLNSGKVKEYGKMPLCWDGVHADHIRETFKQKKTIFIHASKYSKQHKESER